MAGWYKVCPYTCWGLLMTLFLLGCSDDSELDNRQRVTFEAQPCATAFVQEEEASDARPVGTMGTTRSWTPPDGYYLYSNSKVNGLFDGQKDLFYKSIDVFFTSDGSDPLHGTFSYKTSTINWRLSMDIEEADDYYIYGYIPKEVANSATITGNSSYSEGAVLTIQGIKTVTHSDVSVIVGAKDGSDENTATSSISPYANLTTGDFKVHARQAQLNPDGTTTSSGTNYIYLLFDHLYSALAFNFTIDATYNELRTIKVRKLELIGYEDTHETTNIPAKYNVVVKLKSNGRGTSPIESVTFSPDNTSGDLAFEPIYEATGAGLELTTVKPANFMGCFVPGQNTYFKLRTTYDVYDKNQQIVNGVPVVDSNGEPVYNLIRRGCEAENVINLSSMFSTAGSLRGQMFKITIKVVPTYLYVLSEPDMDNPTLTIDH